MFGAKHRDASPKATNTQNSKQKTRDCGGGMFQGFK
jgi:hypothetical protein